MKNIKKGIFITFILCLFLVNVNLELYASSGKLRSASICQGPNGIYYGQHSSDNHWHAAVKQSNGWYPNGGIVGGNPCSSGGSGGSTSGGSGSSNSGSGSSNSGSSSKNSGSTSSNSGSSYSAPKPKAVEKSNEKPVITAEELASVKINKIDDFLLKEDILKLFSVKVTDKEDGTISNDKIKVSPEKISEDELGDHDITISYTDKDGNNVEKEVVLTIKEDGKPIISNNVVDGVVKINKVDVPKSVDELIELLELEVRDQEDGIMDVTKDNVNLDKEASVLTLSFVDEDGNKVSEDIEYVIVESSIIEGLIGIGLIGLIGYGIFILYGKFKSKK